MSGIVTFWLMMFVVGLAAHVLFFFVIKSDSAAVNIIHLVSLICAVAASIALTVVLSRWFILGIIPTAGWLMLIIGASVLLLKEEREFDDDAE
ncbi:MAG: hypothetical protein LBL08_02995 [Candidatus Nomurabacteria bacterium]|jgi:hypothetical protein|nr:hypothetical protein [Candidatus Nomurabacteria bacterium]